MKLRALALIALFATSTAAIAGEGHKKGFAKYDANADGYISLEELGANKAEKFAKLDSDGDGLISKDEYHAYKAMKKKKRDEA